MLLPVASALEDISLNRDENGDRGRGDWNVDSRNDAQSLLNAITFTFIVVIVVVRHILDLARPPTLKLQRKEIDLLKAKDEIALLKHALADMQRNIDVRHHQLYVEARSCFDQWVCLWSCKINTGLPMRYISLSRCLHDLVSFLKRKLTIL